MKAISTSFFYPSFFSSGTKRTQRNEAWHARNTVCTKHHWWIGKIWLGQL